MPKYNRINTRRGNAAVFAVALIPILGFGAMSVDIGMQRMTTTQIQAAAEAGANGGSAFLDGTSNGLLDAIDKAVAIANMNYVYGGNFAVTSDDVELGIYDQSDGSFTVVGTDWATPGDVNAVRVVTDTTNTSILSGAAFGVTSLTSTGVSSSFVQRGGVARYVDCYLPFAIPVCHFLDLEDGDNPEPMMLNLSNLNTLGWGLPNTSPNTNLIKDQLQNTCNNGTAETGDDTYISNGQNNSALFEIADLINDKDGAATEPWPSGYFGSEYYRGDFDGDGVISSIIQDPPGGDQGHDTTSSDIDATSWGWNINGVVPIIDHPCGGNFTGTAPIVGWTYAYIYDVVSGGGDKYLWMQFDFVNDYDIGYGQCQGDCYGNVTGTYPPQPIL